MILRQNEVTFQASIKCLLSSTFRILFSFLSPKSLIEFAKKSIGALCGQGISLHSNNANISSSSGSETSSNNSINYLSTPKNLRVSQYHEFGNTGGLVINSKCSSTASIYKY